MLDRQYHLYSVDTGYFFSSRERYLHNMNCRYRLEYGILQKRLSEAEAAGGSRDTAPEALRLQKLIKHKKEKAKKTKERLLALLANKVKQNELTDGRDHVRALREDSLHDTDIISAFDSALSRTIGIRQDEATDALLVVQVYYFDVFKDLCFYGFTYKDQRYIYFTSSAGQIRQKKTVFIQEAVWSRIEKTVMCGLTADKINSRGGNNVNKHLAYMALTNSATDEWTDFDIDKSIVVPDFETDVYGTFDFVDERDYSITRKTGCVPIPHTDGAGMVLPSVSAKNFMFRAPWIKGLLGVFDFKRFIEARGCSPVITDIYGKRHDVIREDIRVIFTKSQFKMHPYYDSWEEYKDCYKKYRCSAGRCNVEEDRIGNARINYQMLQTLTDISEEEIDLLTRKSSERISGVCNSRETMMDILGITPYNTHMSPFQRAVKLYPALLSDTYAKDILREVKNSLLKKYRSGKLEITGKYTFLLPDFYAACEYWFCREECPEGLLADGEVFCSLFRQAEKLDCLRSPHLYKEHAIRYNTAHESYGRRAEQIREWFVTDGLYASTHDLISKLLMYDVDGDKSLVVADRDFVRIAERNMEGIVPLYYNMRKAEPAEINSRNIYAGLIAAFTGGNIGFYSNHISKIWNDEVFLSGSKEEQQDAMDCVKRLCCQNNFVIDYAKTLYKPEFPKEIREQLSRYANAGLPAFFEYAKDKEKSQVSCRSGSLVNRIYDKIPDRPINTRGLKLGQIDYRMLMSHREITCSREVSDAYDSLSRQYRHMIYMKDESADNLRYIACKIRERFSSLGYSDETTADMLVEYLYGRNKRYKQVLWFCYGRLIVIHLEKNLRDRKEFKNTKYIRCADCGEWFEAPTESKSKRCRECSVLFQRERTRLRVEKYRNRNRNDM